MLILLLLLVTAYVRSQAPPVNDWATSTAANPSRGPAVAYHAAALIVDGSISNNGTASNVFEQENVGAVRLFMFIFGGINSFFSLTNALWMPSSNVQFSSDLWVYLINTMSWILVPRAPGPSTWPHERSSHIMEPLVSGNTTVLVLYGGRNFTSSLSDTWLWSYSSEVLYSTYSASWTPLGSAGPGARWGGQSLVHNNTLYYAGGYYSITVAPMEVWAFSLTSPTSGTWSLLHTVSAGQPGPRGFFSFGLFALGKDKRAPWLLVSGGWDDASLQASSSPMDDWWAAPLPPVGGVINWSLSGPAPAIANGQSVNVRDDDFKDDGDLGTIIQMRGVPYSPGDTFSDTLYPAVNNNVFMFNSTSLSWTELPLGATLLSWDTPDSTIGQSAIVVNREVVLYGGFNTFLSILSDRLTRLVVTETEHKSNASIAWVPQATSTEPDHRMCALSLAHNGTFFVMGGWMSRMNFHTDIWAYSIALNQWTLLPIATVTSRVSGTAVVVNNQHYLYGGNFQHDNGTSYLLDDIVMFDPHTMTSTHVQPVGIIPAGRQLHSAVSYQGSMYVFGGVLCPADRACEGNYTIYPLHSTAELWAFVPATLQWVNLTQTGFGPSARNKHSAAVLTSPNTGPQMYIFGGVSGHTIYGDLWAYNLVIDLWYEFTPSPSAPWPAPRCWHFAAAIGESSQGVYGTQMHVYNGIGKSTAATRDDFIAYTETWVFDAVAVSWTRTAASTQYTANVTCPAYGYDYNSNTVLSFGGAVNSLFGDAPATLLNSLSLLTPGCNPGSSSVAFQELGCTLCGAGSYSDTAGATECVSCSANILTAAAGATSKHNCSLCESSTCNNNGACSVSPFGEILCDCNFGYNGQLCQSASVLVVVICASVTIPAVYAIYKLIKIYRRRSRLVVLYRDQFEEAAAAVELANEIFSIPFSDLSLDSAALLDNQINIGTYFGMRVVLKVVANRSMFDSDEDFKAHVKDFSQEAKTLATLHHLNIARFFGTAVDPTGSPLLVEEFCERGSLHDVLVQTDRLLGWPEMHQMATHCALGLAFLHSRTHIHGDVRSPNIYVTADWVCKIGDFGTAVNMRRDSITLALYWTAPELLPDSPAVEPSFYGSSDVYSLGIVFWEIATGRFPYHDSRLSPDAILSGVARSSLRPSLTAIKSCAPPTFRQLIEESWQSGPHSRPRCVQIVAALAALRPDFPAFQATAIATVAPRLHHRAFDTDVRHGSTAFRRRAPARRASRAGGEMGELLLPSGEDPFEL
eukprot:m.14740 g.14740  ORF g.14740 m.14740 type:complete len:1253 (-) comp2965_c0_seq1:146-3904(-)